MLIFRAMAWSLSIPDVDVGEQILRGRRRRRLRFGHRALDQLLGLPVDRLELRRLDDTGADHLGIELLDAVLVGAQVLDLAAAPVGLLIALEVAEEADHLALEQRGAASPARAPDDLAGCLVDAEEVRPVHGDPGQAESGR